MSTQPTDKKSFRTKLSHFLGSHRGKTIFNFCYGFGAALAILGTLFKLLHLEGANIALSIGLGTEVFIFALSAFEPPFRNYRWEEVFPILMTHKEEDRPDFSSSGNGIVGSVIIYGQNVQTPNVQQNVTQTGQSQRNPFVNVTTEQAMSSYGLPQELKLTEEESQ